MNTLEIGWISLNGSQDWLQIMGEGRDPLITSLKYGRKISAEPEVEETISLHLRGNLPDLQGLLSKLYGFAERSQALLPGHPLLYLRTHFDGEIYRSPVTLANVVEESKLPEIFDAGSLRVRVTLRRKNYYESEEFELPLALPGGQSQLGGVTLYNHSDGHSGHHGAALLNRSVLSEGLALGLRLELTNNFSGEALGDFALGLISSSLAGYFPKLDFEAEAGAASGSVASESDSGSAYLSFSWTGNDWAKACSFRISETDLALMGKKAFLPVLRLKGRPADGSLRFRLRLKQGSALISQTQALGLAEKGNLVFLPTLRFGQDALPGLDMPSPLDLELELSSAQEGAHLAELDCLRLLPKECSAFYRALNGLGFGGRLFDEAERGRAWSRLASFEAESHRRSGSDWFVPAGSTAKMVVLGQGLSGLAAIERSFSLRIWGRKRRQIL